MAVSGISAALTTVVAIGAAVAAFQQVYLTESTPRTQARLAARVEACDLLLATATESEREIHIYLTKYGETVVAVEEADWKRVENSQLAFMDAFHRSRTYFTRDEGKNIQALSDNLRNFGMVGLARKHGAIAGFDNAEVDEFMDIVHRQIEELRDTCGAALRG